MTLHEATAHVEMILEKLPPDMSECMQCNEVIFSQRYIPKFSFNFGKKPHVLDPMVQFCESCFEAQVSRNR